MIQVESVTFLTYGGRQVTMQFAMALFHEPLWKVKEQLLDKMAPRFTDDPIVKVVKLKYHHYGE